MKKIFFLTIMCMSIFFAVGGHAQTALGLRFSPDGLGFSGKFFTKKPWAVEAQVNAGGVWGAEGESFNAVGLFEYHIPLGEPSWRVFLGAGGHIGAWKHNWHDGDKKRWDSEPIFGIDGIAGIEYVFRTVPLGLSFDIKPAVNFISNVDYFPHNVVGFGARFYL